MTRSNINIFGVVGICMGFVGLWGYVIFGSSFEESLLIAILGLIIVLAGVGVE